MEHSTTFPLFFYFKICFLKRNGVIVFFTLNIIVAACNQRNEITVRSTSYDSFGIGTSKRLVVQSEIHFIIENYISCATESLK